MDTISLYNNTVEGLIGGLSTMIPVTVGFIVYGQIRKKIFKNDPKVIGKVISTVAITLYSIALGTAVGIVGGVLADNYTDSAYNGIKYGVPTSGLVALGGFFIL